MKLSDQARRMIRVILSVNVAAAAVSLIHFRSKEAIPFILGLLVGGGTSLLRVLLLERVVNKVISGDKPGSSVQVSHLGRLLIAFAALLVGAMVEGIHLFGVIVGLFLPIGNISVALYLEEVKSHGKRKTLQIQKTIRMNRKGVFFWI